MYSSVKLELRQEKDTPHIDRLSLCNLLAAGVSLTLKSPIGNATNGSQAWRVHKPPCNPLYCLVYIFKVAIHFAFVYSEVGLDKSSKVS